MTKADADILRKKYLYKKMILSGKVKLPYNIAKKLIGPDCAYHLYSKRKSENKLVEKQENKEENSED